jgi:hypothetical protein
MGFLWMHTCCGSLSKKDFQRPQQYKTQEVLTVSPNRSDRLEKPVRPVLLRRLAHGFKEGNNIDQVKSQLLK